MNPLVVVGIMAVAVTVVIGLLYLVRSVEPASGLTVDTNRATVFYGMVSTAFAVLLAFVVLVSFQSFNQGKSGAESEAVAVVQLFRTAAFFPAPERETLQAEIACYARAAVSEWPAMRKGGQSRVVDMWVARMQQTLLRVRLGPPPPKRPSRACWTPMTCGHGAAASACPRPGRSYPRQSGSPSRWADWWSY